MTEDNDIPDWAVARMKALIGGRWPRDFDWRDDEYSATFRAFLEHIVRHEEPPPAPRAVLIAREACAQVYEATEDVVVAARYREGQYDCGDSEFVCARRAAELALSGWEPGE